MYKSWMWKQRSFREQFEGTEGGSAAGGADEGHGEAEGGEAAEHTDQPPEGEGEGDTPAEPEEVVVSIGDEVPEQREEDRLELSPVANAAWAKKRKENSELAKRIRELEAEKAARESAPAPAAAADEVGREPDMADEDIEYDNEVFKTKWVEWNKRKAAAEVKANAEKEQQAAVQANWNRKLTAYREAGAKLNAGDFDAAEATVSAKLNTFQQQALVLGPKSAEQSAKLVSALSRNQAQLDKLAGIKDGIEFVFALADIASQLKVNPARVPPAPERAVRGTAGNGTGVDNALARLEAEADRTGDRTKIREYRDQKRRQSA